MLFCHEVEFSAFCRDIHLVFSLDSGIPVPDEMFVELLHKRIDCHSGKRMPVTVALLQTAEEAFVGTLPESNSS